MPENSERLQSRWYLKHEPLTLGILTTVATLLFLFVTGLSHLYQAQRAALASRWAAQGAADLGAQRFNAAAKDFRTALLYSGGNYSYQLELAQALIGERRTDEAKNYLTILWNREPEDGLVNLELARIAVRHGETDKALRYYHNAIYATWSGTEEKERRSSRLELVNYLLTNHAQAQAQSELIALAANLDDDPAAQANIGDLFMQADDDRQALTEYRLSLTGGRRTSQALAGAGRAAFELGAYAEARKYLQQEAVESPGDAASAALLETAIVVLDHDPFRQELTAANRDRIVAEDFAAAGARMKSCQALAGAAAPSAQSGVAEAWAKLKPRVSEEDLRRDPDLVNAAMELVFKIEGDADGACGTSSEVDAALLRIASLHEGF